MAKTAPAKATAKVASSRSIPAIIARLDKQVPAFKVTAPKVIKALPGINQEDLQAAFKAAVADAVLALTTAPAPLGSAQNPLKGPSLPPSTPSPEPTPAPTLSVNVFQAKLFRLQRHIDHTNATGEGVVAEGVEFTDGTVAVRWKHGESTFHDNVKKLETLHCNFGTTSIVWM